MQQTTEKPRHLRAVIYARVGRSESQNNTQAQIDVCRQYAAANAIAVVRIYEDCGFGGIWLDRPELNRLRADVAQGDFDLILMTDMRRLALSIPRMAELDREFSARGVEIEITGWPSQMGKQSIYPYRQERKRP